MIADAPLREKVLLLLLSSGVAAGTPQLLEQRQGASRVCPRDAAAPVARWLEVLRSSSARCREACSRAVLLPVGARLRNVLRASVLPTSYPLVGEPLVAGSGVLRLSQRRRLGNLLITAPLSAVARGSGRSPGVQALQLASRAAVFAKC